MQKTVENNESGVVKQSTEQQGARKKGGRFRPDTSDRRGWRFRRVVQVCSFILFLGLLLLTVSPLPQEFVPVDLFLRLDPSVAVVVPLAARQWISTLWPGLALLFVTLAVGRLLCGYLCPMGITLDIANFLGKRISGVLPDRRVGKAANPGKARSGELFPPRLSPGLRQVKYLLLAVLVGSAALGVNFCYWFSPIPLITRFYALLLHPVATLAGHEALVITQPLASALEIHSLSYLQVLVRRFDSMYFLLFFFCALFVLEQIRPRFWCRYICPAGGLLGMFSLKPLWKRQVHSCVSCGACARECPTEAILSQGKSADHGECITCQGCVDICPVNGVGFAVRQPLPSEGDRKAGGKGLLCPSEGDESSFDAPEDRSESAASPAARQAFQKGHLPSRRHFLFATMSGVGLAGIGLTSLHSVLREEQRGILWSELCIRPPGAVPEPDFLSRCLRCGQCMKVCPTNGLQPTWFAAGVEGMFSPVLVSRRGACEPDCNACGQVCPTRAITSLPLKEKHWAKIGTAAVIQSYCLAWAEKRSCVVCEEVCPYGAIKCERQGSSLVPVPVVKAERCFGCGYCEQHCPVRVPAIVVRPLNALRLHGEEYEKAAREMGMTLEPGAQELKEDVLETLPPDGLPPGFTE
jgi:Polyferredoxin